MSSRVLRFASAEILAARPPKNAVDPRRPYAYFVEPERTASGSVEQVAAIFLTNRECPYRCLICDLWKNTTDVQVPVGAIPEQIEFALERLPAARHIKLYNSGNFFDPQAIPWRDHDAIASRVGAFENVIVENHPRFCTAECLRFRDRLGTSLEIAIGLETVHPVVLPALNKRMGVEDFDRAVKFLVGHGIAVRAFILLRLPFLDDEESLTWAIRSIEHAFSVGVSCCAVIPTRSDNGIMEQLQSRGHFSPPSLGLLERVLVAGLALRSGRVFVDLWDSERLTRCPSCAASRIQRLGRMNLSQLAEPDVICGCGA
jgi:radical SAM enzyme (TIGR01210 family)